MHQWRYNDIHRTEMILVPSAHGIIIGQSENRLSIFILMLSLHSIPKIIYLSVHLWLLKRFTVYYGIWVKDDNV